MGHRGIKGGRVAKKVKRKVKAVVVEDVGSSWAMPKTADELHWWLREVVGIVVPRRGLIEGNSGPFEYLVHSFFEGRGSLDGEAKGPLDCVVWANRGGGKTFLGAVATMLDVVFKPGIEVRILGGSMDQSRRMHVHLRRLFERPGLAGLVSGRTTERRMRLRNGSEVELLAQSQVSVRGTRVQKLRCDEVELFDRDVWEAAQLTTRSKVVALADGRAMEVRGTVECLSTMHRPWGIMHTVVEEARAGKRALFRWGVVDVLDECGPGRACRGCALLPECDGKAKLRAGKEHGHVGIDDAIRMKDRVSRATWESEMLSLRPRRTDAVLPEFDPAVHVVSENLWGAAMTAGARWFGGMDFGFRAPTAFLWGALDDRGVLWIVDERVVSEVVLDEHIAAIGAARWPRVEWIGADPAGNQSESQTGATNISLLRKSGFVVKDRRLTVREGLELVRARLRPAVGGEGVRLHIHARCVKLIESLSRYHYDADKPESDMPVKDGFDHAVDALRYLVSNLDRPSKARFGEYV